MSEFTYQKQAADSLEYFEWENLWYDNAPKKNADRVVIIGDSISCGYRKKVSVLAGGKFFVDGIGTSKAVDNPYYIPLIEYFATQTNNTRAVVINNGLHGWHLNDDEYEQHFSQLVEYVAKKFPNAELIIATTTPPRNSENLSEYGENYNRVISRNIRAIKIAEKHHIKICDFFALLKDKEEVYLEDGVHLAEQGYDIIAECCYRAIDALCYERE